MSQSPLPAAGAPAPLADASAAGSEKSAKSPAGASAAPPTPAPRLRSCVVCRSRKVRCDKQSPCQNCKRANIPCVFPGADRPPRWARRLDRIISNAAAKDAGAAAPERPDPGVNQVMDRLHTLEGLVKELTGQLEQARAASGASAAPSAANSPRGFGGDVAGAGQREVSPTASVNSASKQFGRLVVGDANHSRYVSSGFWSRVIDELNGLKTDTRSLALDDSDTSDDEASSGKTPSTQGRGRTPEERHGFLFGHNLSSGTPDLKEFHPLPSQIPFLLNVYAENVNVPLQVVHIPTVNKMVRDLRLDGMASLTPSNEALLFAIYYSAIVSLDDEDIVTNFGTTKSELSLKYQLGLERALAKADFVNKPDIVLVQAFALFLLLARRSDNPRYVWMMTGMVIRMGQALGLHRDGSHFEYLTPYEVEMRRRVWWALCFLDLRSSEDQATDLTIAAGSSDTKLPRNLNDSDIDPSSKVEPAERQGLTDVTYALISYEICEITRRMTDNAVRGGGFNEQERLLNEIYQKVEQGYLRHMTDQTNVTVWLWVCLARMTMSKMTLIIYLPELFSSPDAHLSDELRDRLLVCAIELAEYNHVLNAERAVRQYRWIYQTYTHWHAIVYLLIDISRRPWSPIVERGWVALHSSWLIPAQASTDKNLRVWVPLKKLMAKASKHRDAELERLQNDPLAVQQLETDYRTFAVPNSYGPFPTGSNAVELFRERWRQLVAKPEHPGFRARLSGPAGEQASTDSSHAGNSNVGQFSAYSAGNGGSEKSFQQASLDVSGIQADQYQSSSATSSWVPDMAAPTPGGSIFSQAAGQPYNPMLQIPSAWSGNQGMGADGVPWLWADGDGSQGDYADLDAGALDIDMDLGGEVNWFNWIESAKGMEWDVGQSGSGQQHP